MYAAQQYNAVGNAKMAVWHARKAVAMGIVGSEDQEADEGQMSEVIGNPRGHWTWGVRRNR